MVFITAAGGGTGPARTGGRRGGEGDRGAHRCDRDAAVLLRGTYPERQADGGTKELRSLVDTIIVIPNEKLLLIAGKEMRFVEAFRKVDDVLFQAVRGIPSW